MNNIICLHPALDIIPHYLSYISICFFALILLYHPSVGNETLLSCLPACPVFSETESLPAVFGKQFKKVRQENPAAPPDQNICKSNELIGTYPSHIL
jgi:hypothetical protein